jgi:uncharacterized membrane protein SirB2
MKQEHKLREFQWLQLLLFAGLIAFIANRHSWNFSRRSKVVDSVQSTCLVFLSVEIVFQTLVLVTSEAPSLLDFDCIIVSVYLLFLKCYFLYKQWNFSRLLNVDVVIL